MGQNHVRLIRVEFPNIITRRALRRIGYIFEFLFAKVVAVLTFQRWRPLPFLPPERRDPAHHSLQLAV